MSKIPGEYINRFRGFASVIETHRVDTTTVYRAMLADDTAELEEAAIAIFNAAQEQLRYAVALRNLAESLHKLT